MLNRANILAASSAAALACALALAGEESQSVEDEGIDKHLSDLANDDYDVREYASEALAWNACDAWERLWNLTEDEDPEVAVRAHRILGEAMRIELERWLEDVRVRQTECERCEEMLKAEYEEAMQSVFSNEGKKKQDLSAQSFFYRVIQEGQTANEPDSSAQDHGDAERISIYQGSFGYGATESPEVPASFRNYMKIRKAYEGKLNEIRSAKTHLVVLEWQMSAALEDPAELVRVQRPFPSEWSMRLYPFVRRLLLPGTSTTSDMMALDALADFTRETGIDVELTDQARQKLCGQKLGQELTRCCVDVWMDHLTSLFDLSREADDDRECIVLDVRTHDRAVAKNK